MAHRAQAPPGGVEELQRFFALSLDLLGTVGFDATFRRVNPAWEAVLGWREDELIGRPYAEIIHPEDRERTLAEAARVAMERSETQDFEIRLFTRTGGLRLVSFSAAAAQDPADELIYIVGRDITDRHRAESALRESELRLRSVTDSLNDAVVSADEEGLIRFWSPAARRIFGRTEEEMVGQPLSVLMPERYRAAHLAGITRRREGGEPRIIGSTLELHGLRGDGEEFPLELSLGELELEEGRVYTGVVRDITGRRRAGRYLETQLAVARAMAETGADEPAEQRVLAAIGGPMGWRYGELWRCDSSGERLRAVATWAGDDGAFPRFRAMSEGLSFARGEGLPGAAWERAEPLWIRDVQRSDNFPRSAVAVEEGLHGAVAVPMLHHGKVEGVMAFFSDRIERPDDELRTMMATLGARVGEFVVRRDAERALAETAAELERRARELERSNADLEQFAYVASHDLSEPLRMVSGFVGLLAKRYEGQLDAEADEFIAYAVEGVTRMRALIDDLLAFSRLGRAEQDLREVDCEALLGRVLQVLGPQIDEVGGEVVVGPLPAVRGDETQLGQLFQNLLSNALKFRGERAPRVEVTGSAAASGMVELSVRDNGIGVEPQYAERIFKVFQRLHGREEYEGTGIGLAICQRIVERHGGRIWLQPAEGSGADFRFTLPAATGPVA